MPDARQQPKNDPSSWENFLKRHAGHRFLQCDPLYSLSTPVIDAIKKHVPRFLSEADEQFERDLCRTADFGFFLREPLGLSEPPCGSWPGKDNALQRQKETASQIEQMVHEQLTVAGHTSVDIAEDRRRDDDRQGAIAARNEAYAFWLLSNPTFRQELAEFRTTWDSALQQSNGFPWPPTFLLTLVRNEPQISDAFREACLQFFARWSLLTMMTWDWPVPMDPSLNTDLWKPHPTLNQAGAWLFIPWQFLRGEKIDPAGIFQQIRLFGVPDHLEAWVAGSPKRRHGDFGDDRRGKMLWLYRFEELALRRRYPQQLRGNAEKMNLALSEAHGDMGKETARKLRQEFRREIDAADPAPETPKKPQRREHKT